MRLDYFEWIKHLYIQNYRLTGSGTQINSIKYVLNQLESLKLDEIEIEGDFYETILKHCPNVKHLSVMMDRPAATIIGGGNDWLHRQYPMLEHIQIVITSPIQYPELFIFFQQNPNIRIFSTDTRMLALNHHLMLRSNIKFDYFKLIVSSEFNFARNILNRLHENGFYDKLHVFIDEMRYFDRPDHGKHLWSFNALEMLSVPYLPLATTIPVMESITKLGIIACEYSTLRPLKLMAENFLNLKHVRINAIHVHLFRVIVCLAPKLEQIKVYEICEEDGKPIDFSEFQKLNAERKKLVGARKVTIYIKEELLLRLKWKTKLNLSLIELKRIASIETVDIFE